MYYKNKFFIIGLLLFVALLAISAVSAVENTTDIATVDLDMSGNEIQAYSNDDAVKQVNDREIVGKTDNGTFSDLQTKIDAVGVGGVVNLENNYAYDDSFSNNGIIITNPITINGNGFTINGMGQSRIFNITSLNNVILNNITFMNGNSNLGGAIILNGDVSGIVIDNCKFINNTATQNGGAIYAKGAFINSTIKNSEFASNIAAKNGGAIYFLINSGGNLFENISFSNNRANGADGGAINFHAQLTKTTFNNLTFLNNHAANGGGAINTDHNVNDNNSYANSTFINNSAKNGGAFNGYGYSNYNSFETCVFINNSASNHGGAIYYSRNIERNTLNNCVFVNNSAKANGGALYSYRNSNYNKYNNTVFIGNVATNNGGAIYNRGYSDSETYNNCVFINNSALSVDGGCINVYANLAGVVFDNVLFINNSAAGNGGAINVDDDAKYVIFFETAFINNTAGKNGGALSFDNSKRNMLENTFFIQNQADIEGSAIHISKNMSQDKVIRSYFINNSAYGAVIDVNGTINSNFEAIFVNNTGNAVIRLNFANDTNISDGVFLGNIVESTIAINSSNNTNVNNNVFLNNESTYEIMADKGLNADYNWFGNNATNYDTQPNIKGDVDYDTWLFLNATASPNNITVFDTSNVVFLLYNYNSTSGEIYEHYLLGSVELTITATNGDVNDTFASLGEAIEFDSTTSGIAGVTASMGGAKHTINLMVKKLPTQLTANPVTAIFNVNKNMLITLTDINGNAISGAQITVNLNGAKKYTTDKNGQVKVSIKGMVPKTYTAKIAFNGNTNYDNSTKSVKVTVKKATPKITAKAKTFKTTTKTKKYTITLKDNKGKAIKNAKVTLKVKGKTYAAKTNSKGKATFKITKLNKKGTFKATVTYKGSKYYNKVSKKAKITVKLAFKTVSKGSKDSAIVKKIQRALKNNGYYLTYQGHYLKVDGIYGDCTVRSVKEFQKDNGLKVTGKVDENTAKKLGII